MTYIGLGRRFVAWLVDGLITGLAWVPFAETSSVDGTYSIRWEGIDFVIPLLITLAYFVLLEGAFGATIGKLVLGIRVRALDGTRIGFGAAAIRNLARVVDGFPYLIPYLVGAIAVSRSETDQRLGDRWAKTVVVLVGTESKACPRSRPRCRPRPTPSACRSPPPGAAPPPTEPSLPPPPPVATSADRASRGPGGRCTRCPRRRADRRDPRRASGRSRPSAARSPRPPTSWRRRRR